MVYQRRGSFTLTLVTTSIYLDLTREFNAGRLRCILSSGQAVVLHRLAIMSKDGDWIVREDAEALHHVLTVLETHGARYRLGAPLDVRWMAGGWSTHFEFQHDEPASSEAVSSLRVRTDFVTRPPRLSSDDLAALWQEWQEAPTPGFPVPVIDARRLADLKKTNRERDYAVIGELARRMSEPRLQMLYSRSARDLQELAAVHPQLIEDLKTRRPLLTLAGSRRDVVEAALDVERRTLMHANEARLAAYSIAATNWSRNWAAIERQTRNLPLRQAHEVIVQKALELLPFRPEGIAGGYYV